MNPPNDTEYIIIEHGSMVNNTAKYAKWLRQFFLHITLRLSELSGSEQIDLLNISCFCTTFVTFPNFSKFELKSQKVLRIPSVKPKMYWESELKMFHRTRCLETSLTVSDVLNIWYYCYLGTTDKVQLGSNTNLSQLTPFYQFVYLNIKIENDQITLKYNTILPQPIECDCRLKYFDSFVGALDFTLPNSTIGNLNLVSSYPQYNDVAKCDSSGTKLKIYYECEIDGDLYLIPHVENKSLDKFYHDLLSNIKSGKECGDYGNYVVACFHYPILNESIYCNCVGEGDQISSLGKEKIGFLLPKTKYPTPQLSTYQVSLRDKIMCIQMSVTIIKFEKIFKCLLEGKWRTMDQNIFVALSLNATNRHIFANTLSGDGNINFLYDYQPYEIRCRCYFIYLKDIVAESKDMIVPHQYSNMSKPNVIPYPLQLGVKTTCTRDFKKVKFVCYFQSGMLISDKINVSNWKDPVERYIAQSITFGSTYIIPNYNIHYNGGAKCFCSYPFPNETHKKLDVNSILFNLPPSKFVVPRITKAGDTLYCDTVDRDNITIRWIVKTTNRFFSNILRNSSYKFNNKDLIMEKNKYANHSYYCVAFSKINFPPGFSISKPIILTPNVDTIILHMAQNKMSVKSNVPVNWFCQYKWYNYYFDNRISYFNYYISTIMMNITVKAMSLKFYFQYNDLNIKCFAADRKSFKFIYLPKLAPLLIFIKVKRYHYTDYTCVTINNHFNSHFKLINCDFVNQQNGHFGLIRNNSIVDPTTLPKFYAPLLKDFIRVKLNIITVNNSLLYGKIQCTCSMWMQMKYRLQKPEMIKLSSDILDITAVQLSLTMYPPLKMGLKSICKSNDDSNNLQFRYLCKFNNDIPIEMNLTEVPDRFSLMEKHIYRNIHIDHNSILPDYYVPVSINIRCLCIVNFLDYYSTQIEFPMPNSLFGKLVIKPDVIQPNSTVQCYILYPIMKFIIYWQCKIVDIYYHIGFNYDYQTSIEKFFFPEIVMNKSSEKHRVNISFKYGFLGRNISCKCVCFGSLKTSYGVLESYIKAPKTGKIHLYIMPKKVILKVPITCEQTDINGCPSKECYKFLCYFHSQRGEVVMGRPDKYNLAYFTEEEQFIYRNTIVKSNTINFNYDFQPLSIKCSCNFIYFDRIEARINFTVAGINSLVLFCLRFPSMNSTKLKCIFSPANNMNLKPTWMCSLIISTQNEFILMDNKFVNLTTKQFSGYNEYFRHIITILKTGELQILNFYGQFNIYCACNTSYKNIRKITSNISHLQPTLDAFISVKPYPIRQFYPNLFYLNVDDAFFHYDFYCKFSHRNVKIGSKDFNKLTPKEKKILTGMSVNRNILLLTFFVNVTKKIWCNCIATFRLHKLQYFEKEFYIPKSSEIFISFNWTVEYNRVIISCIARFLKESFVYYWYCTFGNMVINLRRKHNFSDPYWAYMLDNIKFKHNNLTYTYPINNRNFTCTCVALLMSNKRKYVGKKAVIMPQTENIKASIKPPVHFSTTSECQINGDFNFIFSWKCILGNNQYLIEYIKSQKKFPGNIQYIFSNIRFEGTNVLHLDTFINAETIKCFCNLQFEKDPRLLIHVDFELPTNKTSVVRSCHINCSSTDCSYNLHDRAYYRIQCFYSDISVLPYVYIKVSSPDRNYNIDIYNKTSHVFLPFNKTYPFTSCSKLIYSVTFLLSTINMYEAFTNILFYNKTTDILMNKSTTYNIVTIYHEIGYQCELNSLQTTSSIRYIYHVNDSSLFNYFYVVFGKLYVESKNEKVMYKRVKVKCIIRYFEDPDSTKWCYYYYFGSHSQNTNIMYYYFVYSNLKYGITIEPISNITMIIQWYYPLKFTNVSIFVNPAWNCQETIQMFPRYNQLDIIYKNCTEFVGFHQMGFILTAAQFSLPSIKVMSYAFYKENVTASLYPVIERHWNNVTCVINGLPAMFTFRWKCEFQGHVYFLFDYDKLKTFSTYIRSIFGNLYVETHMFELLKLDLITQECTLYCGCYVANYDNSSVSFYLGSSAFQTFLFTDSLDVYILELKDSLFAYMIITMLLFILLLLMVFSFMSLKQVQMHDNNAYKDYLVKQLYVPVIYEVDMAMVLKEFQFDLDIVDNKIIFLHLRYFYDILIQRKLAENFMIRRRYTSSLIENIPKIIISIRNKTFSLSSLETKPDSNSEDNDFDEDFRLSHVLHEILNDKTVNRSSKLFAKRIFGNKIKSDIHNLIDEMLFEELHPVRQESESRIKRAREEYLQKMGHPSQFVNQPGILINISTEDKLDGHEIFQHPKYQKPKIVKKNKKKIVVVDHIKKEREQIRQKRQSISNVKFQQSPAHLSLKHALDTGGHLKGIDDRENLQHIVSLDVKPQKPVIKKTIHRKLFIRKKMKLPGIFNRDEKSKTSGFRDDNLDKKVLENLRRSDDRKEHSNFSTLDKRVFENLRRNDEHREYSDLPLMDRKTFHNFRKHKKIMSRSNLTNSTKDNESKVDLHSPKWSPVYMSDK